MKRVLVVDDDDDVRTVTASILGEGFEVATAEDGQAALAMIATLPFDAVVLDVEMPFVGGLEVVRALHAHGLDVPVLLASAREDIAALAKDLGVFDVLLKPFAISLLRTKLACAMGLAEDAERVASQDLRDGSARKSRLEQSVSQKGQLGGVA